VVSTRFHSLWQCSLFAALLLITAAADRFIRGARRKRGNGLFFGRSKFCLAFRFSSGIIRTMQLLFWPGFWAVSPAC
jgi:hypothetical protein